MVTRNTPGGEFFGALREMDRKINAQATEIIRGARLDILESTLEAIDIGDDVLAESRGPKPYLVVPKNQILNGSFRNNLDGWTQTNLTATRASRLATASADNVARLELNGGQNSGTFTATYNLQSDM